MGLFFSPSHDTVKYKCFIFSPFFFRGKCFLIALGKAYSKCKIRLCFIILDYGRS